MDDILKKLVDLVNDSLIASDDGIYILEFTPSEEQKDLLTALKNFNAVDEITQDGNVIDTDEIVSGESVKVEVIQFALQQFKYYENFEALINANDVTVPSVFYVRELKYLHPSQGTNDLVRAYFAVVNLINCLIDIALFKANENIPMLYLVQDKSAVGLPLIYNNVLLETHRPSLDNIESFVEAIKGHSERKKIYLKELIDFINNEVIENQRLEYLYKNFNDFYTKCEAAYAFFLSDFSYSKLKLELENAILDYSRNIRSIINDSQTRLIAIPAAFIVASTQLDLNKSLSLKNILIVIASFIFSFLIEIFIRNQESSLKIFSDNITSYKTTFKLKNEGIGAKEVRSLQAIIAKSFKAIDSELQSQKDRLQWIRLINWGLSAFLVFVILGLYFYQKVASLSMLYSLIVFLVTRYY